MVVTPSATLVTPLILKVFMPSLTAALFISADDAPFKTSSFIGSAQRHALIKGYPALVAGPSAGRAAAAFEDLHSGGLGRRHTKIDKHLFRARHLGPAVLADFSGKPLRKYEIAG